LEFHIGENTLYYEVYGHGHPLVILHSMGTDHQSMKAWIEPIYENLAGFMRIYVDLPRHGRSDCKHIYSTEEMVSFLLQFIDQTLFDKPFALLAHSFGGYLAQGILSRRKERVTGICLLASALHTKQRTLPDKVVKDRDESILSQIDADARTAFQTLMVYQNKENLELFLEEVQPGRLLADREFLASNWREQGYFYSEDPFKNIGELEQPALFIAGKHDSICGYKDYFFLLDHFPNSTFTVIDQAGHLMTIEKRNIVHSLVKEWLIIVGNRKLVVS
jgi:pimeloyl-ACP methyl ester carboxylesterase